MAGSEGVGQTDLLTGWSCVVHQPSEDPEPSELPSTVDIAAFSSGLGEEPVNNANNDNSTDSESESDSDSNNSGSDVTGSCSQSESSDSDSSSSSVASSSSSQPEFSVTSSQTNGLRLTIAPVRKTCNTPVDKPVKNTATNVKTSDKSLPVIDKQGSCNLSSSSSRSDDTGSDNDDEDVEDDDDSESDEKSDNNLSNKLIVKKNNDNNNKSIKKPVINKVKTRLQEKKCDNSKKKENVSPKNLRNKTKQRRKKMASLPLSRGSSCTSSDSEDSDADSAMLASCSLQEIRQEDLAAILPDQQECDGFGGFECRNEKTSTQPGDASGSDMELPQQAVNALIQRTTESSSDSESPHPPLNPNTLCANSLLQQFVEQTQMLNTPTVSNSVSQQNADGNETGASEKNERNVKSSSTKDFMKRKRGRPRKVENVIQTNLNQNVKNQAKSILNVEYSGEPDVSPDSGIQNSPDHRVSSPDLSPLRNVKSNKNEKHFNEKKKKDAKKLTSNNVKLKTQSGKIPVTANKYDRVLYANTDRVLYPPRRKAGRPPLIRKGPGRPPKNHKVPSQTLDVKKTENEEKIVESTKLKSKKLKRIICDQDVKQNSLNLISKTKENKKSNNKTNVPYEYCDNVNKKENGEKKTLVKTKAKFDRSKAKYTTLKNSKLMHSKHKHKKHKKCKFKILKPAFSTSPNPDPKINSEIDKLITDFMKFCFISNNNKVSKENVPDMLKTLKKVSKKRKNSDIGERKKKKQNVITVVDKETNNEQRLPLKKRHYHLSNSEHKEVEEDVKIANKSNDKQKLLLPNNNTVEKIVHSKVPSPKITSGINNNEYEVNAIGSHIDEAIEACINRYSNKNKLIDSNSEEVKIEISSAIVINTTTPKKRHRLETTTTKSETEESSKVEPTLESSRSPLENVVSELKMKRNLTSKFIEQKRPESGNSTAHIITRKKNRLEDLTLNLVTKISNAEASTTSSQDNTNKRKKNVQDEEMINTRASVIKSPPVKKPKSESVTIEVAEESRPVPKEISGIFTPTVDLELTPTSDVAENEKQSNEVTVKTETLAQNTAALPNETSLKKKVRKRRAINRTGFPTIKKKKKKVIIAPIQPKQSLQQSEDYVETVTMKTSDDRVPRLGEEYSTFVERTETVPLATEMTSPIASIEDGGKWEDMSECDSLPQEERIEFEPLQEAESKVKTENVSQDLDEVSLQNRISRLRKKKEHKAKEKLAIYKKLDDRHFTRRRFREISPASSVENTSDKKIKDDYSLSGDEIKRTKKPPRWRKKYLVAGLFSDYYKEDDETARQRRQENITSKSRIVYNPEEHPYGLLPPPYHCGRYLRCRKIPFQLPYDLWWQHSHSQLPGRDIVPSWNYRKIRTNVYNVKTTTGACEPQPCNCSPSSGCGDDCINRLVLAECPASHKCQNQRIQKHEWAPGLEKFMTENKGWGVRTNLPIKHCEFILEYVGEVVSDHEFKERMATRYVHDTHHYCLHLDGGLVIDGHRMGGDGRFVNHSCQPNCEMQKWTVNGQFRMALYALRDIEGGEELTYDYNFSLFNPAEGQQCMCGSDICRGVIGGKTQRTRPQIQQNNPNGRVGRPRKNLAKRTYTNGASKEQPIPAISASVIPVPPIKPLSNTQKTYILEHHCFLLRNLNKVKKLREKTINTVTSSRQQTATPTDNTAAAFLSHLNALQKPRNMKTRRLAQVEDDPELKKAAKLASLLQDLWKSIVDAKDETGAQLCLPLLNVPSKRKVPEYYQRITNPIDLSIIEQNITSGVYKTAENFDDDMNRLFANTIRFYGRTSEPGIATTRLKKIYCDFKQEASIKFEDELGVKPPAAFITKKNKGDEEDVIRCICGMYRDEGLMIQCERCLVWQHSECVQADASTPSYHCEKCVPRDVDYEIPMNEYTEHGHRYYMTLSRDDLQLRQGDTVYVLRDITIPGTNKKHTYETIGKVEYTDLDIFRIERLWKNRESGQRFAYGHHYLRPHETYHEPTRKFFPNEVMRVPLYEAVPVDLIIRHCWVLDLNTFCKGRPIEATEEHIYICEYRVDKTARLFSKASKSKFPICTKSYAFEKFDVRLKVSRTYVPHDLNPAYVKPRGRKPQESEDVREITSIPLQVPVRTRDEQKARLNKILLNLLSKLPTKQVLDVSYLLEAGRRRKKPI